MDRVGKRYGERPQGMRVRFADVGIKRRQAEWDQDEGGNSADGEGNKRDVPAVIRSE